MIVFNREYFPVQNNTEFLPLWEQHGIEVAGKPLDLNTQQYMNIEDEGRLIWIVARADGRPIGYSGHVIYYDRHFKTEKIAADDIWYVKPEFRGKHIGITLKKIGLYNCLKEGATQAYDLIRGNRHSLTLKKLGYSEWGTRWSINL